MSYKSISIKTLKYASKSHDNYPECHLQGIAVDGSKVSCTGEYIALFVREVSAATDGKLKCLMSLIEFLNEKKKKKKTTLSLNCIYMLWFVSRCLKEYIFPYVQFHVQAFVHFSSAIINRISIVFWSWQCIEWTYYCRVCNSDQKHDIKESQTFHSNALIKHKKSSFITPHKEPGKRL